MSSQLCFFVSRPTKCNCLKKLTQIYVNITRIKCVCSTLLMEQQSEEEGGGGYRSKQICFAFWCALVRRDRWHGHKLTLDKHGVFNLIHVGERESEKRKQESKSERTTLVFDVRCHHHRRAYDRPGQSPPKFIFIKTLLSARLKSERKLAKEK